MAQPDRAADLCAVAGLRAAKAIVPAENPGLTEWRVAHQREAGTCGLCAKRPSRWTCYGCRLEVCFSDRWTMFGLCRRCVKPADLRRWHEQGKPEESNWLG